MMKFDRGERSSYQERVSSRLWVLAFPMHRRTCEAPGNPCSMDETGWEQKRLTLKLKAEEAMQLAPPLVLGRKR
jgi:hypothetical protein